MPLRALILTLFCNFMFPNWTWAISNCSIALRSNSLRALENWLPVSDLKMRKLLSEGSIISVAQNSEVTHNTTYTVVLQDESGGRIKANFKAPEDFSLSNPYAEESAYFYSRRFPLARVPITVTRKIPLEKGGSMIEGSLQLMEDISTWESIEEVDQRLKTDGGFATQFYFVRLLQFMIYDKDKNVHNIRFTKAQDEILSLDHDMSFGLISPMGNEAPVDVSEFPANVDFTSFTPFYDEIKSLSDAEYAEIIAPLVVFAKQADPDNLGLRGAQVLNYIMSSLMIARERFIEEMELRRSKNKTLSNATNSGNTWLVNTKEFKPYPYFSPNSKTIGSPQTLNKKGGEPEERHFKNGVKGKKDKDKKSGKKKD